MSDDHASNAISAYGSRLAPVFRTPNLDRIAGQAPGSTSASAPTPFARPRGLRSSPDSTAISRACGRSTTPFPPTISRACRCCCNRRDTRRPCSASGTCTAGRRDLTSTNTSRALRPGNLPGPRVHREGARAITHRGYVTDILTDMTLDWLRARQGSDRPFFVMCHHKAPHDFWEYATRHEHLFDGLEIPFPDSLFEDRRHRSAASRDYGSSVTPRSKIRSLYADFCREDYVTGPLRGTEGMTFRKKAWPPIGSTCWITFARWRASTSRWGPC